MKKVRGKALAVNWWDGTPIGCLFHTGPIYFTYEPEWLAAGHNLSPLMLPFDPRPQNIQDEGCHGLPGFIADALPDAWGTRVAEALFLREGWGAVTPMKLLAWIGDRAPGALTFQPALKYGAEENWLEKITAERLAHEAQDILRGHPAEIAAIAAAGGSAGGAYPKALVIGHADGSLSLQRDPGASDEIPCILKLGLPEQPSLSVEYAYLTMAREAGIDIPSCRRLVERNGSHLLIQRFDWLGGRRLHLHSLSGLWHKPKAGLDYADLFRAAARLGLSRGAIVEIARRLLFNLYACNHDDHGRNHAFLYDRDTMQWSLSPAFDLTYAPGALSRGLTIAGEVRPSAPVLTGFLESVGIRGEEAAQLCDGVLRALGRWDPIACEAGVPEARRAEIAASHALVLERVGRIGT